MNHFEALKKHLHDELDLEFEERLARFVEVVRAYPNWATFMATNWWKFTSLDLDYTVTNHAGVYTVYQKGLKGLVGYNLPTYDCYEAMEVFSHFISHEVFDDGEPAIVWLADNRPQRLAGNLDPDRWRAWRLACPPPGDTVWHLAGPDEYGQPALVCGIHDWVYGLPEGDRSRDGKVMQIADDGRIVDGVYQYDILPPELVELIELYQPLVTSEPCEVTKFLTAAVDHIIHSSACTHR